MSTTMRAIIVSATLSSFSKRRTNLTTSNRYLSSFRQIPSLIPYQYPASIAYILIFSFPRTHNSIGLHRGSCIPIDILLLEEVQGTAREIANALNSMREESL